MIFLGQSKIKHTIFLWSISDCCIWITLFIDTHISYYKSHVAIWLCGFEGSQYRCLPRELNKFSKLVKIKLIRPVIHVKAYFHFIFLKEFLCKYKQMWCFTKYALKLSNLFWMTSYDSHTATHGFHLQIIDQGIRLFGTPYPTAKKSVGFKMTVNNPVRLSPYWAY